MTEKTRYIIFSLYMLALVIIGLLWPGESLASTWAGFQDIMKVPGVLISDFFSIGGVGATLINSGLVGFIGLGLIYFSKTHFSGPTIAAVFTMAGFGLFGKTPINIWPIILGVGLAAALKKDNFRSVIVVALFGTALGPLVSQVAFGLEWGYIPAVLLGIGTGLILPAMASHVLHNHQGFNLYNVGFTCGIVGIYLTAMLTLAGEDLFLSSVWYSQEQWELGLVFFLYFGLMMVLGLPGWKDTKKLWKLPGTLVTDFVTEEGMPATLFNMGLVGLIGMTYILLVGGEFNGPTLGGVFTMVGFGAFGKHLKNIWPLMAGVYLGAVLSSYSPSAPGPLLAALFGTTLAPVAGNFGPVIGILAGVVHLSVVMISGPFHAGMNLYNNGFAGGLVATVFVGVSRWLNQRPHKKKEEK